MKKAGIRSLCLVLAAGLVLTTAGCAGSGTTSGSSSPAASQTGSSDGKVDFGGKTLKVAVWYEPEKPTLGISESGDAWYYSLKNAEKQYNCKVEWVINTQDAHFSNFIQKSLSNEVYADILMCHSWNYVSLIKQQLLEPTTEYVSKAADADHWNQTTFTLNGENWGLMPQGQYYTPTNVFLINTKLLNKLKLDNPQELAKNGTWTWDKFREYCRAATDPAQEQYGVGCFMLASVLKTTNNVSYMVKDEATGKYMNGLTFGEGKTRAIELLEFLQKLSVEDKAVLGSWDGGTEAMDETVDAFKDGKLLFAFVPSVTSLKKSGFTDYSVVTPPLGPSATGLEDVVDAFAFWSLPSHSDFSAADRAAFWMEAKRIWDPSDTEGGYYEESEDEVRQELLDLNYVTMEDVDFLLTMGRQMRMLPGVSLSTGPLIADDIFGAVIRGDGTPASVLSATDGELQSIIDSTYNS